MLEQYEDSERLNKTLLEPFRSPYQDFLYYASSVTPELRLAMNVIKPILPAPILIQLHGWHMSMPQPLRREQPGESPYLVVQVDMRGRAFSSGVADCNGLELIDIYDAVQFVRKEYGDWIVDPELVYLEGGSGGGGNVLAAVAKFPDLFAAATALYGVSDYARWYEQDLTGEFRDDMDVWIGCHPQDDPQRYAARSGLALAANLHTPLYLTHGDGDIRIPVIMSRLYVEQLNLLGKAHLIQYDELPSVGDRSHMGRATIQQLHDLQERSEANRQRHGLPIELAPSGVLQVGGYVYTKHFHVHLESVNRLATLHYDLDQQTISIYTEQRCSYRLQWSDGSTVEGECEVGGNDETQNGDTTGDIAGKL
ncbi:prolyl oligopeptidase family serine peptidase [Paenibacillus sp. LMG 31461]|uniref:Prolyl oligopeptidase family serine peptidase n=1 Tax=Paenibacillus plantarum TaxID=2654975 RepID=A0ABX1X672_9BACL|nr:prolyl oligopeptidase family serine peptidase [Paenibacillus plantarum]NOU63899.1 prolyl oligopeptidase family serine peptidase [Paenibacillus plantarum]